MFCTLCHFPFDDEAKGTFAFGETFHLQDRGEDWCAGNLQGELRMEKEEEDRFSKLSDDRPLS